MTTMMMALLDGHRAAIPPPRTIACSTASPHHHYSHRATMQQAHSPALPLASRIRSTLVCNFRSWWWLPLPLEMMSTPSRHSAI